MLKSVVLLNFYSKLWYISQDSLMNGYKGSKVQHLFENEIKSIHVCTNFY